MKDRIRALRKHFHLTQPEFGARVGVSRDVVASFECGRVEPSEPVIRVICQVFNADYGWLKSGHGEMFASPDDEVLATLAALLEGEVETPKMVLRALASLTGDQWEGLAVFLQAFRR